MKNQSRDVEFLKILSKIRFGKRLDATVGARKTTHHPRFLFRRSRIELKFLPWLKVKITPHDGVLRPLNFSASFLCCHCNDQFPAAEPLLHFSTISRGRLSERQRGIDERPETARLQQLANSG